MNYTSERTRRACLLAAAILSASPVGAVRAQAVQPATESAAAYPIDLPTALRLARAENLDVLIAQKRLDEAHANRDSALWQFFPWISPGVTARRHEGRTQAVDGTLLDVDKQSIAPGATLTAQLDLGDGIFKNLVARQLVNAASLGLDAQRQDTTLGAAQAYFELAKTKAVVEVVREALRTSEGYGAQLHAAVTAGVVFKGDELRVQTQSERYRVALTQAQEQQRIASARLAQILHLDPTIELVPTDSELVPITLVETTGDLQALVRQALEARPELKQNQALIAAAREAKRGAVYGPLIPSLGVQAFLGEFGGGQGDATGNYGASRDYYVGLSWRIGPGGLFDFSRINVSQARLETAELTALKTSDDVARQVVEGYTRVRSLSNQIAAIRHSLSSATETLRLTRERKQLGVGIVLEDIQAQQELVRARADYLSVIAEFNKAQYVLGKVLGNL
jgi:outer membrane protein TolC